MANRPNACDLRVYAEALGGEIRHYHDKMGLECDAVMHLPNGSYALFEVKIGGKHLIDKGARTLTVLSDLIAKKKLREPVFKMGTIYLTSFPAPQCRLECLLICGK